MTIVRSIRSCTSNPVGTDISKLEEHSKNYKKVVKSLTGSAKQERTKRLVLQRPKLKGKRGKRLLMVENKTKEITTIHCNQFLLLRTDLHSVLQTYLEQF